MRTAKNRRKTRKTLGVDRPERPRDKLDLGFITVLFSLLFNASEASRRLKTKSIGSAET
jgi:hypothetical protein